MGSSQLTSERSLYGPLENSTSEPLLGASHFAPFRLPFPIAHRKVPSGLLRDPFRPEATGVRSFQTY